MKKETKKPDTGEEKPLMNAIAIRKKMDDFFKNVKPGEIVKYFEELGYEFEDIHAPISGDAPKESLEEAMLSITKKYFKEIRELSMPVTNSMIALFTDGLKSGAAYQHKVTQAETVERVNQYFDNLEYPDTPNRADLITAIKQMKA